MKKVRFDNTISIEYISETVSSNILSNNISYYNLKNTDNSNEYSHKDIYQLLRNENRKKNRIERIYLNSNEKDYECPTSDRINNKKFNFSFSCFESITINIFRYY
jgi:hypothetical protein